MAAMCVDIFPQTGVVCVHFVHWKTDAKLGAAGKFSKTVNDSVAGVDVIGCMLFRIIECLGD